MRLSVSLAIFTLLALEACAAEAQVAAGPYTVKPSEVAIPAGEKLGEFRRVIQPFKNWTLICDESLKSKQRVCNITQSIINSQGSPVFNWSLIATANGKPLMMMRIPAASGSGQPIELALGNGPDRIIAQTDHCDANFCSAVIAVGDMLKRHIHAGTDCTVSYQLPQAGTIALQAPLEGLYSALAGLK